MGSEFSMHKRKEYNELSITEPVEFSVPKPYTPSYRHSLLKMIGEIDKDIYSETLDYRQLAPPSKALPLGTLSFKVEYESYEEKLTIHLVNAKRLPVRHHVTKVGEDVEYNPVPCDVKVLICLLPGQNENLESSVKQDNRDPVFDELFVINISKQDLRKSIVRLSVFDSRRLHHLCPIGHALYSLKAQDLDGAIEVQREIKPQSQTDGHSRGQLYLSLQYLSSQGRVVLKIIQAQDILHFEKACFKEYYVKVCHIYTDRKVKTKRSSTVEGTRNMVFDCSFSFPISTQFRRYKHLETPWT
ncbi:synaptotagmin-17-like isoform X2 [Actinia tenebrosa]|uniref:Synaptotagmin-17-like isoform X2 n=1 Tax=Actinia tenebrosa TaxID=6105 RepID=A0A6P8IMW1_ACTTE|nr:synaptotagmin-17-like isoform X2 [Actinia tenebrosa]